MAPPGVVQFTACTTVHGEPRLHFSACLNTHIFTGINDLANPFLNKNDDFVFLRDEAILRKYILF